MKYFVVFSLVFLGALVFYLTGVSDQKSSLKISKLEIIENSEDASVGVNLTDKEDKSFTAKLEEKVQLREVTMTPEEIEELKLSDFHAYLRHEDRVLKQEDRKSIDSLVNPEERKKIAKERLAVRLIEQLNSKK